MTRNDPSSPVCYATSVEIPPPDDTASPDSVQRWRKQQRERLLGERIQAGGALRRQWQTAIVARLRRQLLALPATTLGFYWPFKGEVDCRPLVRELMDAGWQAALPAVVARATPLEFRPWTTDSKMVPGIWKIPVPDTDTVVSPAVLLIPLVGFDGGYFRLGYGGGYYDRTIAACSDRPLCIGIGFELSRLSSIYPQPHDIPMDRILTEQVSLNRHD